MLRTQRSLFIITSVGILIIVALACNIPQGEMQTSEALTPETPVQLTMGSEQLILSESISPAGGTITIHGTQSPIDNFQIEIPTDAFDQDILFKIGYREITAYQGGEHFNPITPLIMVDNGKVPAQYFMKVTIPIEIAEDEFAMAVFYDEATHEIEGMPVINLQDNSITVATRHFSEFFVTVINEDVLHGSFETQFQHGVHNWQFPNSATYSYLTPGGICAGMSLTEMYAFDATGGAKLFGVYDNYNNQRPKTKDLYDDDTLAIRLASFAHQIQRVETGNTQITDWLTWQDSDPKLGYLTFGYLMYLSGKPQLLYVANTNQNQAHAVVAYKKNGHTIYISDPNDPATHRTVEFDFNQNKFKPYKSSAYTGGPEITYPGVFYLPKREAINWAALGELWNQFSAGSLGPEPFPTYDIVGTIQNQDSSTREISISPGMMTSEEKLMVSLRPNGFVGRIVLYDQKANFFDLINPEHQLELKLKEGDNWFGFLIDGNPNKNNWIDFQWINIYRGISFDGTWFSTEDCGDESEFPYTWTVALNQNDAGEVTGTIRFHKCDGGYVVYSVTGQVVPDQEYIELSGTKVSGAGNLFESSAPDEQQFTFTPGWAPSPNLGGR